MFTEGPPIALNKKQKKQLSVLESSMSPDRLTVSSTLSSKPSGMDLEQRVTPCHNPYDISEEHYKHMLVQHRKRRRRRQVSLYAFLDMAPPNPSVTVLL